jgi:hypothetical protein
LQRWLGAFRKTYHFGALAVGAPFSAKIRAGVFLGTDFLIGFVTFFCFNDGGIGV